MLRNYHVIERTEKVLILRKNNRIPEQVFRYTFLLILPGIPVGLILVHYRCPTQFTLALILSLVAILLFFLVRYALLPTQVSLVNGHLLYRFTGIFTDRFQNYDQEGLSGVRKQFIGGSSVSSTVISFLKEPKKELYFCTLESTDPEKLHLAADNLLRECSKRMNVPIQGNEPMNS